MRMDKLTNQLQSALADAQSLALGKDHNFIEPVHLLGALLEQLASFPDAARILISAALIAPLAFCMGMPFPLGLARLADFAPDLIPWAWAINGCASVISAVLATLLAIHLGFATVIAVALLLYALSLWVFPAPCTA